MSKRNRIPFVRFRFLSLSLVLFLGITTGCTDDPVPEYPNVSREEKIPEDAIKITPETDSYPPILHSDEWETPIPISNLINTAGGEDSPFIPIDRDELYFFFTPDVNAPAEQQVMDNVSGIYVASYLDGVFQKPERVWLQESGKLALDGAEFVQGNDMLFATSREGYTGIHWFSAEFINGRWSDWQESDFDPDFQVGELHIHENELYYHSYKAGGSGKLDIWKLTKMDGVWGNPINLETVNTSEDEGWPYITSDGNELWFTRVYQGTPAIYRSLKLNNEWTEPELIISRFSGEPTLDKYGNLFFTHIFYENEMKVEADIYVAYRK